MASMSKEIVIAIIGTFVGGLLLHWFVNSKAQNLSGNTRSEHAEEGTAKGTFFSGRNILIGVVAIIIVINSGEFLEDVREGYNGWQSPNIDGVEIVSENLILFPELPKDQQWVIRHGQKGTHLRKTNVVRGLKYYFPNLAPDPENGKIWVWKIDKDEKQLMKKVPLVSARED